MYLYMSYMKFTFSPPKQLYKVRDFPVVGALYTKVENLKVLEQNVIFLEILGLLLKFILRQNNVHVLLTKVYINFNLYLY